MKRFVSYDEYLQSPEWKALSRLARQRAENRCQVCNSSGSLHVHHREYPKEWGQEPMSSLVVLCAACHGTFHGVGAQRTAPPPESFPSGLLERDGQCGRCRETAHLWRVRSRVVDEPDGWFCAACHAMCMEIEEFERILRD